MAEPARARACVVFNCAAMAVDGRETCQVHALALRCDAAHAGRVCRRCHRRVIEGAWLKAETFNAEEVEHVACKPAGVTVETEDRNADRT